MKCIILWCVRKCTVCLRKGFEGLHSTHKPSEPFLRHEIRIRVVSCTTYFITCKQYQSTYTCEAAVNVWQDDTFPLENRVRERGAGGIMPPSLPPSFRGQLPACRRKDVPAAGSKAVLSKYDTCSFSRKVRTESLNATSVRPAGGRRRRREDNRADRRKINKVHLLHRFTLRVRDAISGCSMNSFSRGPLFFSFPRAKSEVELVSISANKQRRRLLLLRHHSNLLLPSIYLERD